MEMTIQNKVRGKITTGEIGLPVEAAILCCPVEFTQDGKMSKSWWPYGSWIADVSFISEQ
jgi:hypothetical protein